MSRFHSFQVISPAQRCKDQEKFSLRVKLIRNLADYTVESLEICYTIVRLNGFYAFTLKERVFLKCVNEIQVILHFWSLVITARYRNYSNKEIRLKDDLCHISLFSEILELVNSPVYILDTV